ncbi:MAG: phosphate acyltransferase PlsX [Acidimicrobiia bacterium]|jgi:glycerol-3-phosphate acyltransferase PlsX
MTSERITVAIDAMGGDNAPSEIVAGALATAVELDVDVRLYGRQEDVLAHVPGGALPDGVDVIDCREVVAMDDEPAAAVRRMKDSSVVRCAQAVRDGEADAMISAGNTGAAMAAALLRIGRIPGIARPAIAVPVPVPGHHPQVLIDAGATVDAAPEWLVQFARMGRVYAKARWDIEAPTIGLLSNGEEEGKGDQLRKTVFDLLRKEAGFVGNVEGSDLMQPGRADVFVTDGFTGNVALKSIESALRSLATIVFQTLESTDEAREASKVVLPLLLEMAEAYDPDLTGGAVLLGVKGVCVISHGSSMAPAVVSAARVARECVRAGVVQQLRETVTDAG